MLHLDVSKYYNSSYLSIVLYRFLLSTYFLLLFLYLYSLFSSDSDYLAWVAGDIVHNHVNISFTDDQLLPGINNYNSNPHGPNRGKQFYTHNPRLFLFINILSDTLIMKYDLQICTLSTWDQNILWPRRGWSTQPWGSSEYSSTVSSCLCFTERGIIWSTASMSWFGLSVYSPEPI